MKTTKVLLLLDKNNSCKGGWNSFWDNKEQRKDFASGFVSALTAKLCSQLSGQGCHWRHCVTTSGHAQGENMAQMGDQIQGWRPAASEWIVLSLKTSRKWRGSSLSLCTLTAKAARRIYYKPCQSRALADRAAQQTPVAARRRREHIAVQDWVPALLVIKRDTPECSFSSADSFCCCSEN